MRKLQGLLIALAALIPAIVYAGMSLAATGSPDCVVAIVKAVSDEPATNGNPPHVTLEITQVLRGDPNSDRRQGLWEPPPNDIDTSGRDAELKAWKAKPMGKPKVGDKYILFGTTVRHGKGSVFYIRGDGAMPFSAERLEQTLKMIKHLEEQTKAYQAKMDAEKKALAEAQAKWRARVTARDIAEYAREADFVGIGKISGADMFKVISILKGSKRYTYRDDSYFVIFVASKTVSSLLDRSTTYLLFLSEKGLTIEPSGPHYLPIKNGDGIVIADEAAVKAIAGVH